MRDAGLELIGCLNTSADEREHNLKIKGNCNGNIFYQWYFDSQGSAVRRIARIKPGQEESKQNLHPQS
jgi:hypothetical protein